jgi:outer membrane immunogenic protein
MKLLRGVVAVVGLFGAGSAFAADLKAPVYKAPPPPAYYDWSGVYAGVNAGFGWENTQTEYSYVSFPAPNPPGFQDVFGPGGPLNVPGLSAVASAIARGFIPTSVGDRQTGFFTAGGQVGANAQFNHIVLGAEADFNWINSGVKSTGFVAPPNGIITNVATTPPVCEGSAPFVAVSVMRLIAPCST